MSDLAATLLRIADDPHNSITSADKLLIEDAARELERLVASRAETEMIEQLRQFKYSHRRFS